MLENSFSLRSDSLRMFGRYVLAGQKRTYGVGSGRRNEDQNVELKWLRTGLARDEAILHGEVPTKIV
jgi:hypothetical protein